MNDWPPGWESSTGTYVEDSGLGLCSTPDTEFFVVRVCWYRITEEEQMSDYGYPPTTAGGSSVLPYTASKIAQANGWISVKERLPEEDLPYGFWVWAQGKIERADWVPQWRAFVREFSRGIIPHVEYWQPALPPAPPEVTP